MEATLAGNKLLSSPKFAEQQEGVWADTIFACFFQIQKECEKMFLFGSSKLLSQLSFDDSSNGATLVHGTCGVSEIDNNVYVHQ